MPATEVVLEVRNLTKYFPIGHASRSKHVHALTDASFTIHRGEMVALVGESGSGKSTTARLITRLIEPTRGEILLHGQDVLKQESQWRLAGISPGHTDDIPGPVWLAQPGHVPSASMLSVRSASTRRKNTHWNVCMSCWRPSGCPRRTLRTEYPYQLSGGQRQRVAIARALAVEPEIILADEPISMLDVSIRMGVLNLIEQLKEERGIGFLYITHDLASARYIGDRTIVMYAGHMVEGAESTELMDQPAHPYTRLLLSAVPNPEAGLTTTVVQARGEIPSLIDPPPGCPFAPRCPHVHGDLPDGLPPSARSPPTMGRAVTS